MKKLFKNLFLWCLSAFFCIIFLTACQNNETHENTVDTANTDETTQKPNMENHAHTFGKWMVARAVSCSVVGEEIRICECGEKETRELPIVKESSGLAYTVNADGISCTIAGIGTCKDMEVGIPSVLDGYTVTAIANSAFERYGNLKKVVIPDTVTTIGERAFFCCVNLASVYISESVTSIGQRAFLNCSNLTGVVIPESVTILGDYAFYDCNNLINVAISEGITAIGE